MGAALAACAHTSHGVGNRRSTGALAVATDPHLIAMEVEPTTSVVASDASTSLALRVQIKASELPDARRPRLNLALVLDTSGSMEGDAIAAVRTSAAKLVGQMRDGDRLSVIAFHSRAELLVPSTPLDAPARMRVTAAIDHIVARGTTDLRAGLAIGLQQIQANKLPDGINRIVLLSDGIPNSSTQLPQLIAGAHSTGIGITTLGLGVDYDSTLLSQIARDTGASFHFLAKPDEVAAVFDQELSKMSTVVGRNLELVLSPGPGVTFTPLPGLTILPDGRATATIGDLAAGEQRDLMIPVDVTARGDGSTVELADAVLSFDDVIARSGRQQRDAFVSLKASDDRDAVAHAIKVDLEVQRIRTDAASAILQAIALARQGQLDAAKLRLDNAAALVRAASSRLSDDELAKIATQLDEVAKQLAQLVPQPQVLQADMRPRPGAAPAPMVAPAAVETDLRRTEDAALKDVTGKRRH